ncbi:MAG: hypothetical protein AAF702_46815 [Chloroflexota bacterium]
MYPETKKTIQRKRASESLTQGYDVEVSSLDLYPTPLPSFFHRHSIALHPGLMGQGVFANPTFINWFIGLLVTGIAIAQRHGSTGIFTGDCLGNVVAIWICH